MKAMETDSNRKLSSDALGFPAIYAGALPITDCIALPITDCICDVFRHSNSFNCWLKKKSPVCFNDKGFKENTYIYLYDALQF